MLFRSKRFLRSIHLPQELPHIDTQTHTQRKGKKKSALPNPYASGFLWKILKKKIKIDGKYLKIIKNINII